MNSTRKITSSVLTIASLLLVLGLFLLGWMSGLAIAQHSGEAVAGVSSAKTTEQQFKNIEVLKGLPAEQLIPAMQFITASLGVECQYCHVQDAFEKDDKKPKQIARKMMEMMFAIDKDNFEGHRLVTCYSCHRGNIHPVAVPAVMSDVSAAKTEGAAPPSPANARADTRENAPSADQLIDKYISAVGGVAAVDKITSRIMKGTITFGDRKVPIDIYSKDPDKRISFTHTPDGDSVTAFDGTNGWMGFPSRAPRDMHGAEVDAAAIDADVHFASHLHRMFSSSEVQGTEKIGHQEAYLVVGNREGKTPLHLYFDKQSGLLLRLLRFADTPLGELPTQIDYADYREDGGVKIPYRWTLARPGGRFTIQISEVKNNVPVDDRKFVKPAAREEKIQK